MLLSNNNQLKIENEHLIKENAEMEELEFNCDSNQASNSFSLNHNGSVESAELINDPQQKEQESFMMKSLMQPSMKLFDCFLMSQVNLFNYCNSTMSKSNALLMI